MNKFYVGMFSLGGPRLMNDTFASYLSNLNINTLQRYGTGNDFDSIEGGFFNPVASYKDNFQYSVLNQWYNKIQANDALFLHREKITRPAFGQSSKYQVEYSSDELKNGTIRPGYGYLTSQTGTIENDNINGQTHKVRRCLVFQQRAGYIVKDLYENLEQVNDLSNSHYYSDRKSETKNPLYNDYRWYVKPQMRVDKSFALNPANADKKAVRVEICKFTGEVVKSVDIKISHFLENNNYDGKYLETYFNINDTLLSVKADILSDGASAKNYHNSKIDYRIYWYGEVDVWIDYVRIDDEWAHFLLDDPDDKMSSAINKWQFNQKIKDEAEQIAVMNGFGYFYMDEFKYNSIPCIAEVNKRIKKYNPNTGLVPVVCENCIKEGSGLKNPPILDAIYDTLYTSNTITDILFTDIYPITSDIPIPDNLSRPDIADYPGTEGYKFTANFNDYDESLNNIISNAEIFGLNNYKNASTHAKKRGWTLCIGTQIHTFETQFNCSTTNFKGLREPTNEEIRLQSSLALAYGAKQIFQFIFTSEYVFYSSCGENFYLQGLLDEKNANPRVNNYYGQNKWTGIADINANIKKIGQFIFDEKQLVYDTTSSVNAEGLSFRYIQNIKSIYRNNQLKFLLTGNEDPANKLYWEIGFFNPDETIELNSNAKYFLVVNKRCAPEIKPGQGDLRELRISFNSNELGNFSSWKLIDALSGKVLATFNITNGGYVSAGIFMPGEGRLFKLEPVL